MSKPFIPRPWQKPMIEHVIDNKRCALWVDMGGGKTSAVLTAIDMLELAGSSFFPVLVIAPLRVARDVWPAEVEKWDHTKHFKVSRILGSAKDRRRALAARADIYTVNIENVQWLVDTCGDNWPFKFVVFDESTKLKGFRLRKGTKRSAALARIARKTHRWVNLTGTPAPNGLKDLWGQTWFLDFGERLGKTWTAFTQRWFYSNPYSFNIEPRVFAQKEIEESMKELCLTIEMKDWVDLKEPIYTKIPVRLDSNVMRHYRELEEQMFLDLDNGEEITALTAAARSMKCLQFASGAVYHDGEGWSNVHDEKLDALDDVIEEAAGHPLVVVYWWRHDAERIKAKFPQARILKTKEDENDWNQGKIPLLLVHPQSAGHGINLQDGGNRIVFFSSWWDLELRQQVIERLGPARQMQSGYDRPVYIYEIIVEDTVDEDVAERHIEKAAVQDLLIKAMKRRRT